MTIAAASVTDEAKDFDLPPGERWLVAHSLPRRETMARDQLRAQGFRALSPLCERTVRHTRKLRWVIAPLFPRDLFVVPGLDRNRWRAVNGTLGIAGLIMAHAARSPRPNASSKRSYPRAIQEARCGCAMTSSGVRRCASSPRRSLKPSACSTGSTTADVSSCCSA